MSGNTRVGLLVARFSPGEWYFSESASAMSVAGAELAEERAVGLGVRQQRGARGAAARDAGAVDLLPHVGQRVAVGVGRGARERERRARRDREVARADDVRREVAGVA